MRADAKRNRQRLLDAAAEEILEVGGDAALDAIAERAGVGIGTLYRHFPNRQALLQAVALHVLTTIVEAGEFALAHAPDGATALRQYLHLAVDNQFGAFNLIYHLIDRSNWPDLRNRAETLQNTIIERAHNDPTMSADLDPAGVTYAIIRFSRPIGIGLLPGDERALSHEHIDTYVDGLTTMS